MAKNPKHETRNIVTHSIKILKMVHIEKILLKKKKKTVWSQSSARLDSFPSKLISGAYVTFITSGNPEVPK